ncbi:STM3941 family protein [Arenimonas sp.]|uniref:STM3941 family protein n=1 Tax=Arenimonas sp. TaxID=1872635 RepID=UPI0039E533AD
MSTNRTRAIPYSRMKLVLLVLGAIVLALGSAWMATLDDATIRETRRLGNPVIVHALGMFGIAFFGLGAVFGLFKLFDRAPGLVLDERGFSHRSSALASGFVPWSDVTGVDVYQIQRQKMLVVKLVNPQKYIEQGNAFRRAINRANFRMCGSPIAISSNALAIDFDELRRLFWDYLSNRNGS